MVSFQCEGCGDVLTKKKLDSHLNKCRNASFTCLDCMTQFFGFDYRKHTSCISEAEKYQGHLYTGKKQQPPSKTRNMQPQPAYIEDGPETPENRLRRVEAPPRAPSPPPAVPPDFSQQGVNVFDFIVESDDEDNENGDSNDGVSSSYKSFSDSSSSSVSSSPSPSLDSRNPKNARQSLYQHSYNQFGYAYGNGPIEPTLHRFNSGLDLSQQMSNGMSEAYKTPASHRNLESLHQSASRSDKKRKRTDQEDLKMTGDDQVASKSGILHSGLTAGLDRLLENPEDDQRVEPSPLSPKKRSKRSKESDTFLKTKKEDVRSQSSNHERKGDGKKQKKSRNDTTSLIRRPRKDSSKQSRMKQIEYNLPRDRKPVQSLGQSNSEFFLSLVTKGRHSIKGQSVWGTLKTFHQGLNTESGSGPKDDATLAHMLKARDPAERRLLKGLRLKVNKRGEIVLFPRSEAETEI